MGLPEVLTVSELRSALPATLKRVQDPDSGPVFVGSYRRPSAVVLSAARYEQLVAAEARRADLDDVLASVRAEGLEPSPHGHRLLENVTAGRMTTAEALEAVLAPYQH